MRQNHYPIFWRLNYFRRNRCMPGRKRWPVSGPRAAASPHAQRHPSKTGKPDGVFLHTAEAGGSLCNIIVVLFVHESSIPEPGRVLRFRRNRRRKVKTPAPQNESAAELGMRQRRLARAGAKAAEADGIGCGKTRTCGERAGLTASDAGMRTIRQAAPHRGLAEEIAVSLFLLPTNAFWIQYTWK